ncbi:hypothetical protein PN419_09995 [Halorubrum ezzemoulense]|uniref:DUF7285 family protein n=1 Tax=Halorubrum ezzemoulense TaxID=337243 RepID=UPI00232CB36F|nr:hypothetical protein [Halorubrum ezzemoulense]MDB9249324.1 hypothetical protein [Halorubrum ezzemoulense]MDB9259520.1 hypothetical protein [Halorubrum ezzemoulense]MDB9262986.1 hypothetical protein [Halorubrum ezzemoulense]MDB9266584.1 hypothetical protein [Halorubrum ezzemoulense]MDB9269881.1 hypothetical protein [Halorubrum ezzemoulense]
MSRDSTESGASATRNGPSAAFPTADRAAVEPIAALVAVVVVGLALGLYAGAFADAAPDDRRSAAKSALDRVEGRVTVGGVLDPDRMRRVEAPGTAIAIELEADGERWLAASGPDAPGPTGVRTPEAVAVAERRVTVRVAPGRNVRGTLRAVVWR